MWGDWSIRAVCCKQEKRCSQPAVLVAEISYISAACSPWKTGPGEQCAKNTSDGLCFHNGPVFRSVSVFFSPCPALILRIPICQSQQREK